MLPLNVNKTSHHTSHLLLVYKLLTITTYIRSYIACPYNVGIFVDKYYVFRSISSKCFRCGELDSDSFITLLNKQLRFYGIYDVMFYGVKINKELFVIVFTFVNVKH